MSTTKPSSRVQSSAGCQGVFPSIRWGVTGIPSASALDATGVSLHQLLLRKGVEGQHGCHGDQHHCEAEVPLRDEAAHEVIDDHRQGHVGGTVEEDDGCEKVIPDKEPGQYGNRAGGRAHERENYAREDLEAAGAVQRGSLLVVSWQPAKEPGVEEHGKRHGHGRVNDDHSPGAADESQAACSDIERKDPELG